MKSGFVCAALFAAATLACVAPAEAASITFNFDCTIINTNPAQCTPGGSWGTLTLADSITDPNRVDVNINITPLAGATGIARFYLNYNNAVTVGGSVDRKFDLVSQGAPAGNHTPTGTVDLNFDDLGPFHTLLDLRFDPSLNPGLSFAGSIVVHSTNGPLFTESNIDLSMFTGTDSIGLYAAYDTLSDNQSEQYGARGILNQGTADPIATPEPATLSLLGMSLLGLGARARRRTTRVRP